MNKHFGFKTVFLLTIVFYLTACGGGSDNGGSPNDNFLVLDSYNHITNEQNATMDSVTVDFHLADKAYSTNHIYDSGSSFHSYFISPFPGNSTISVLRSNDSTELFAAKSLGLVKNSTYTLMAMGDIALGTVDVKSYLQDKTAPDTTKVRMRFIHALSKMATTPLDVVLDGITVSENLDYKSASVYSETTPRLTSGQFPSLFIEISLKQNQIEIVRRTCLVTPGARYEIVLGYKDFNSPDIEIFCHSQDA